jgi:hypothetical protein
MGDRRSNRDRRNLDEVTDPGVDKRARRDRRGGDRRDSDRVPLKVMVRDTTLGGSFEERRGNISMGGLYFTEGHPPFGNRVELRFILPGTRTELSTSGHIVKVNKAGGGFGAHVKFDALSVAEELALAKFFDEQP